MVLPTSASGASLDTDHEPGHDHGAGLNRRRLILCFDGTGNSFDDTNTNVVRLASFLKKDDYTCQMVYYQTGVGTSVNNTLWATIKRYSAYATGWDVGKHIMGGYTFLMQNWKAGDRIYLFGFSRGAYTARALAGMLHRVGLLPRGNDEQVEFAYQMYLRTDEAAKIEARGFKQAFCSDVRIDFVGVWDTVESVGVLHNAHFPFTASGHHIRVFRHAISLDERRVKFMPKHYNPTESPHMSLKWHKKKKSRKEVLVDTEEGPDVTDVQEVWFAGDHGEVGGGNFKNEEPHDPARITLVWMLRELVLTDTGIQFDDDALEEAGIELPHRPGHGRMEGKEPEPEEYPILPTHYIRHLDKRYDQDIRVKHVDQMWVTPSWWILEFLPLSHSGWHPLGLLEHTHFPNFGMPRVIPKGQANVHVSVKDRMDVTMYKPRAKWEGTPTWVE